MQNDLDLNKIASELIQSYIKQLFTTIADGGDSVVKNIQNKLKISYSRYLKNAIKKFSKTKTILYRDKPVALYDFYEHVNLKNDKNIVKTENIKNIIEIDNKLIITGTAGGGKSTLLKHLFVNSIVDKQGIPIFVELRNMNNLKVTLIEHIYDSTYLLGFILEKKYLIDSMQTGGLIIFLDGYDELKAEIKPKITNEIFELTAKYPKNNFIISSRPDYEFISWGDFTELKTQPLTKDQACKLIEKLKYDESIKKNFLEQLRLNLFDKHKDFLSIPLLLTIMLMTYGQNADIPSKMHIFYTQVFDTLFNKHDATKAVYRRKMFTKLAIDDFKTILSAFSVLSYSKHLNSFSYDETVSLLTHAQKITGIKFNAEAYLKDLLKSVCILSQDGILYSFTHRTFQEFFAALFITQAEADVQVKLLNALEWEIQSDKVLSLVFEMQPSVVEKMLIIPKLNEFYNKFVTSDSITNQDRFKLFKYLFSALIISEKNEFEGLMIANSVDFKFCRCISLFYNDIFDIKINSSSNFDRQLKEYFVKANKKKYEEFDISSIEYGSELANIIVNEPLMHMRYLDLMKFLIPYLSKKHSEKAKSIESILFS